MADSAPAEPAKSAKAAAPAGEVFLKTFVLAGEGYAAADHPVHAPNAGAAVQEARHRGLWPAGKTELVSAVVVESGRPGQVSTELTYRVAVKSASEPAEGR